MKLLMKLIKIGWYGFCAVVSVFTVAMVASYLTKPSDGQSAMAIYLIGLFVLMFGGFQLLKFALKIQSNKRMPVRA